MSEDFGGLSCLNSAGAASEQSARQDELASLAQYGETMRAGKQEAYVEGSLAEQDEVWGMDLHGLSVWNIAKRQAAVSNDLQMRQLQG